MKLKHKKKVVFEVDYTDLEEFIEEVYGHSIELVADQEWNNDESHPISISKKALSNPSKIKVFKETGKGDWLMYHLLEDMCNNGLIEEGHYLINVNW